MGVISHQPLWIMTQKTSLSPFMMLYFFVQPAQFVFFQTLTRFFNARPIVQIQTASWRQIV